MLRRLVDRAEHWKLVSASPFLVVSLDKELDRLCREEYSYNSVIASDLVLDADAAEAVERDPSLNIVGDTVDDESSEYIRADKPKFRRLGIKKALFIRALLSRGYSVLVSDADTVWFEEPWEWFGVEGSIEPAAALYKHADILLANDSPDYTRDTTSKGIVMNTGVLFVRATAPNESLMLEWARRIALTTDGNDQTELNHSTSPPTPTPSHSCHSFRSGNVLCQCCADVIPLRGRL